MKTANACALLAAAGMISIADGAPVEPAPWRVPARMPDRAETLAPGAVRVEGWLGRRIEANARNRLLNVDTAPLLAGFRQKPGSHPWIGEHVGKWLHAATLAWAYTGDAVLREKLDRVVAELTRAQEADGYLGTYVPEKRFGLYLGADWDVWSHKYNLIGLLTYWQYTGNEAALNACRKMGDLLAATFPAKKSILAAGTHVGMAATSVLEPMVLLYRCTGETRYLEFARYLVKAWDEPNGPRILQTLLAEKQVNKTANAKAYEMLSNLVGLCELARATGEEGLIEPVLNAWQDIVDKRLYLTGSASIREHFQGDHVLPNQQGASLCETCVTTTWIQLNWQLLRLTGQARFANELERTFYNHLAAAQHPDGADWCYFTALEGRKPYDSGVNCCHSSGPRGMALAPLAAFFRAQDDGTDQFVVSTFESGRAALSLGGARIEIEQHSAFPQKGEMTLRIKADRPARFAIRVREPDWAAPVRLRVNGNAVDSAGGQGWAASPVREWKSGDTLEVSFSLGASVVSGAHGNLGRVALRWGPFVMACDDKKNPGLAVTPALALAELAKPPFVLASGAPLTWSVPVRPRRSAEIRQAVFETFADAGSGGGRYVVWLREPGEGPVAAESLLAEGRESRSRRGNLDGSINDGDSGTIAVTFDGRPAAEDWYAIALPEAVKIGRIVFGHGRVFHDGGWFDSSAGKPRVQVQRAQGGAWETVGELAGYPATTAQRGGGLRDGQRFDAKLSETLTVWGVRVAGKPASGDNPQQAFSSCAELEAYLE